MSPPAGTCGPTRDNGAYSMKLLSIDPGSNDLILGERRVVFLEQSGGPIQLYGNNYEDASIHHGDLVLCSYFLFVLFYIDPGLISISTAVNKYSFGFRIKQGVCCGNRSVPGGFAKLAAALVVEACAHGWPGAVLLTLVAGGLSLGTAAFCTLVRRKSLFVLHYVPRFSFW